MGDTKKIEYKTHTICLLHSQQKYPIVAKLRNLSPTEILYAK